MDAKFDPAAYLNGVVVNALVKFICISLRHHLASQVLAQNGVMMRIIEDQIIIIIIQKGVKSHEIF